DSLNHEATKSRRAIRRFDVPSCLRDFVVDIRFVVQSQLNALSFTSIAAGFALFTADLSAAPGLGHAVSFPYSCTENIHTKAKRLANGQLSDPRQSIIVSFKSLSRIISVACWHADGYRECPSGGIQF